MKAFLMHRDRDFDLAGQLPANADALEQDLELSVLFSGMAGMAFGAWMAGAVYDYFGFYAPAFATGIVFNLINLVLIGTLVLRSHSGRLRHAMA